MMCVSVNWTREARPVRLCERRGLGLPPRASLLTNGSGRAAAGAGEAPGVRAAGLGPRAEVLSRDERLGRAGGEGEVALGVGGDAAEDRALEGGPLGEDGAGSGGRGRRCELERAGQRRVGGSGGGAPEQLPA